MSTVVFKGLPTLKCAREKRRPALITSMRKTLFGSWSDSAMMAVWEGEIWYSGNCEIRTMSHVCKFRLKMQHHIGINRDRKIRARLRPWTSTNFFYRLNINSWKDFKGELCTVMLREGVAAKKKKGLGITGVHPSGRPQSGQRHQHIHYAAGTQTLLRPLNLCAW